MELARTEQRALADLNDRLSRSDPWLAEAFACSRTTPARRPVNGCRDG